MLLENGQKLELPDGLWNSMAAKGTYRLFVTDAQTGQVAFLGTIRVRGTGQSIESLRRIAGPIRLRNAITAG